MPTRWIALIVVSSAIAALGVATAEAVPGFLDTTFAGDGRQLTGFQNGNRDDQGYGIAIQGDGKILVAGFSAQAPAKGGAQAALARYNKDGTLDKSLSGDGRRLTRFMSSAVVAVQDDGKIVLVGVSDQGAGKGGLQFALLRLNKGGGLDTTFSGDGRQLTGFGKGDTEDFASAVAIDGDGKIVVAGTSDQGAGKGGRLFALARYNRNGSLDQSFDGDGKRLTGFANGDLNDSANSVAVQGNGKIVAGGQSDQGAGKGGDQFALARYNKNGSLDKSFDGDGRQLTGFKNDDLDDTVNGVAIQGDARIVVAGISDQGAGKGGDEFALARYRANGLLDQTFDGDGLQLNGFGNADLSDAPGGLALQGDGKIVVAGRSNQGTGKGGEQFALARYRRNGLLDTTFDGDGLQLNGFANADGIDLASGVAIQANGKIVAAGYSDQGAAKGADQFALARYLP